MITEHPRWEELRAYGQGRLIADAAAALEAHLAGCEGCCNRLADAPGDSFVGRLRDAESAVVHETDQGTDVGLARATVVDASVAPPELADHPRYRVLALLGQGGMGAVYRAEHRRMDRPVALKVIRPDLMRHPTAVHRFKQEVRAAARLDHPNIVRAFDADQAGGLHFLVMEYIDGTSLAELVRRRGPLPVAEACEYARQTALGLQHAHEQGMVHRDVKPQNLMLQGTGRLIRILDFGLARLARSTDDPAEKTTPTGTLTGTGAMMGTADYIAPEQADDAGTADIRADIYALGCTLYFLLTGRPPFPYPTVAEKVACHAVEPLPSLTAVRRDVPAGLAAVLERMTAKDPARRYATPILAAAALAEFCPRAKVRRGPGRKTLAAAAVLLLAAGVTAGVVIARLGHNPGAGGAPLGNEPEPELVRVTRSDEPMSGDAAIRLIEKLGGRIGRNNKLPDRPVTSVTLAETKVTNRDLRAVALFKHLTSLDLRQTAVGDAGMKHLTGLTELRTLSLYATKVTDAGMADVARLAGLEFLSLDETAVTGAGLENLKSLPKLANLGVYRASGVDDTAMKSIARLRTLRSLDLRGTRVGDAGLKELADCTELAQVQVEGSGVTDEGVRALAKLSKLMVLDLVSANITDAAIPEIATHRRLTNLNLHGCKKLTGVGVKALDGLRNLGHLSLYATGVTDAGLVGLAERLPRLNHLTLWDTAVTDASLPELARCPNLSFLCLPGPKQVSVAAVERLRQARPNLFVRHGIPGEVDAPPKKPQPSEAAPMIRDVSKVVFLGFTISLAGCEIKITPATNTNQGPGPAPALGASNDPGVKIVQKLGGRAVTDDKAAGKPLVEAWVGGDNVTDASLKELATCTNLRKLWLRGAKITDDGLKELAALKNLEWLELTSTPITGVGLKHLAGLKNLTYLDLGFSKVNDAGMKSVAMLPQLKTLKLMSAPITDDGLKEAAALVNLEELTAGQVPNLGDVGVKALGGLKNLKRLDITNCDLSDAGLKALAGLEKLEYLHIYGTKTKDDAMKAIAGLPHLQDLFLSFDTTDAGLKALKGAKELRELKLQGQFGTTDACIDDLAQIKTLRKVEFSSLSKVTNAGMDKLRKALPNCNVLKQ